MAERTTGVFGDGLGVEMMMQSVDLFGHRPDHADVPIFECHCRIVGGCSRSGPQA